MATKDKLVAARTALVLDEPFFGALALGLELKEDAGCGTAWTDGRSLGYDPQFIEGLSHAQITALFAHEVLHCANGHPWRRDARDSQRWNIAADRAINQILKDSGFTLPDDCEMATGAEIGKSAEWIYSRLPEGQKQGKQGQGQGGGQGNQQGQPQPGQGQVSDKSDTPDPLGEVRDAPTAPDADGQPAPTESDWQQATQQAAQAAKGRGKLGAGLERFAKDAVKPRVDWRSALRRFIQDRAKSDYSWTRPNRRYVSHGLYMPGLDSTELGEIAVAVDTSGSIDAVSLAQARAELESIIDELRPAGVSVYYADARVCQADRFERGEPVIWRPKGGGGTSFVHACKAAEESESEPVCLIYITDLDGGFPASCSVPVVWITDTNRVAPFGETLKMS